MSECTFPECANENAELQTEIKALKEELDEVRKAGIGTLFELRKVQASRDELLDGLHCVAQELEAEIDCGVLVKSINSTIKKAEALKEKENE